MMFLPLLPRASLIVLLASAATAYAEPSDMPPLDMTAAKPSAADGARTIVAVPVPLPLPGQLKPPPSVSGYGSDIDPKRQVHAANAAARIQPRRDGYVNAMQRYAFADGALYQVYAMPGQVTDIALQEGEQLVGTGPIAAGDTVRWIIGDTTSGTGSDLRVHILVKPTQDDIGTNLVINTDRRTYHLELRATPQTYMASVSWTYPQDALFALQKAITQEAKGAPVATGLDLTALNFDYAIVGDAVPWRPLRAFDDGRQVMIEFPGTIATGEMPPLFVSGTGHSVELVNYRVQGRYMVVDRLFTAAELRLGDRKSHKVVRIERIEGKARRGRRSS